MCTNGNSTYSTKPNILVLATKRICRTTFPLLSNSVVSSLCGNPRIQACGKVASWGGCGNRWQSVRGKAGELRAGPCLQLSASLSIWYIESLNPRFSCVVVSSTTTKNHYSENSEFILGIEKTTTCLVQCINQWFWVVLQNVHYLLIIMMQQTSCLFFNSV